MARALQTLQSTLKALPGVADAYIQPPTDMQYPCVLINLDESTATYADDIKYLLKQRLELILIDRKADSPIADLIEGFPYSKKRRSYRTNGLNHTVFTLYY